MQIECVNKAGVVGKLAWQKLAEVLFQRKSILSLAPNPCKQRLYKGFYFSKFEPALNTEETTFANKILRVLILSFPIVITFAYLARSLSPELNRLFFDYCDAKKRVQFALV